MKKPITTIIAEACVNHNGSIVTAKKMIDVMADAGTDLVKFQTCKDETQFEMIKCLERNSTSTI